MVFHGTFSLGGLFPSLIVTEQIEVVLYCLFFNSRSAKVVFQICICACRSSYTDGCRKLPNFYKKTGK